MTQEQSNDPITTLIANDKQHRQNYEAHKAMHEKRWEQYDSDAAQQDSNTAEFLQRMESSVSVLKTKIAEVDRIIDRKEESGNQTEQDILFVLMARKLGLSETGKLSKAEVTQAILSFVDAN